MLSLTRFIDKENQPQQAISSSQSKNCTKNDKYYMIIKDLKQVSLCIYNPVTENPGITIKPIFQVDLHMICSMNSTSELEHANLGEIQ